jgi:hypothetical protein
MENIQGNLHGMMQSLSLTGNLYIDGLIATTVFGFLRGWLDVIMSVLKVIIEFIYIRVKYFAVRSLSSKFGGKELYKVSYEAPCEIYFFLRKYVLTQEGDNLSDAHRQLYIKKLFEPHYWYHYDSKDLTFGNLEIDFLGKNTVRSKEDNKILNKDKLFFRYTFDDNEYIFSFYELDADYYKKYADYYTEYQSAEKQDKSKDKGKSNITPEEQQSTTIWMEMVSFSDINPSAKTRVSAIESFLNTRFKMDKYIYRTYNISLTNAVTDQLASASRSHINKIGSLAVDYANPKVLNRYLDGAIFSNDICENTVSSKSSMQLNVKQLHNGFKYQDQIKLANRSSQKSNDIVYVLVERYIKKNFDFGYREFLITYEDFLVFFYSDSSTNALNIVTQGKKITDIEVKNIIQHLIEISFTTSKELLTKNQVSVYKREQAEWNQYILSKRSFDSIYLPQRLMKHIKNEFDGFIEIEKLYRECQIPYKKGILFYGPPGTGKTSLVKALAFEYQLPLYIIDVNDDEINDDSIVTILNGLGNNGLKLLLFEDIDTAFADKEQVLNETKENLQHQQQMLAAAAVQESKKVSKKLVGEKKKNVEDKKDDKTMTQNINNNNSTRKKFLTYSGLLNALDGVMSNQSGVITIMTTNYLERLGAAFLRPGRIDVKFELTMCNNEQIEEMTRSFLIKRLEMGTKIFGENDTTTSFTQKMLDEKIGTFVKNLTNTDGSSKVKPCELQFYLLRYIRNISDIFDKYYELTNSDDQPTHEPPTNVDTIDTFSQLNKVKSIQVDDCHQQVHTTGFVELVECHQV